MPIDQEALKANRNQYRQVYRLRCCFLYYFLGIKCSGCRSGRASKGI